MSSRSQAYDIGESRRSPRDRSPGRYNESRDSDAVKGAAVRERRRSFSDTRQNLNAFNANRDSFREPTRESTREAPREAPRGPKGFIETPPSGPRASTFGNEYRGDFGFRSRGGRVRGRGWRDDNWDRTRDVERDYRDWRDDRGPPIREERGRDRDWRGREHLRGRRSPPSSSRPRSPDYGARDTLSNADVDRPKRDSRDGPLSAGSLPAEPSSSFQHGFGRGRGARGRGRGSYFEDYHRAPGRSKSPEPNRSRRSQPSATPPPQVPVYGSTSSKHSISATTPVILSAPVTVPPLASPVPGVVVPTAPRSLRLSQPRIFQPLQPASNNVSIKTESFDLQPPRGPSALETPKGPAPKLEARVEEPADRSHESLSDLHSFGKGQSISHESPMQSSGFFDRRKSSQISSKSSDPYTPALAKNSIFNPAFKHVTEPEPPRPRIPILGRRAPQPTRGRIGQNVSDMDSDSGDDFGDAYFEAEINKVKAQIAKATSIDDNDLLPRPLPKSIYFLQPFIDPPIVDKDATKLLEAKGPCIPPPNEPSMTDSLQEDLLTIKPRSKGRARPRPETPNTDSEINGNGSQSSENAAPLTMSGQERHHSGLSILEPKVAASRRRGHRTLELTTEAPVSTRSITNGKRPHIETFDESDEEVQTEAERLETLRAVRRMMHTPPLPPVPALDTKAWYQDDQFLKSFDPDPIISVHIKNKREVTRIRRRTEKLIEQQRWRERYLQYRLWTDYSEDLACSRSREAFARKQEEDEADAAKAVAAPSITETKLESGRRAGSRFATEHDFERVLRESEREAQENKEREDRISRAKTANSKEAFIPDMAWDQDEWLETLYVDTTHSVPFERSFARLEFGEPIDNFTAEECEVFEKAYLEVPKQWGKIAEALPQRDYKACIQHYYLVKHSSNIKEKLKKQPKRRRRGVAKGAKPRSSALITDLDRAEDVENGQDTDTGDRGRPKRRAAAPTFGLQDAGNGEVKGVSPAATPAKKSGTPKGDAGPNGDGVPPSKKRPKATREKSVKQAKGSQPIAAAPPAGTRPPEAPATPGLPTLQEWKPGHDATAMRFPQVDTAGNQVQPNFTSTFTSLDVPNSIMQVNYDATPSRQFAGPERLSSAPPASIESTTPDRRSAQQTSSYWSVPEQTEFPTLLRHFGTDWHGIAKWMTSKTHIMVKNYYQRQVDSGRMSDWKNMAEEADGKRERGEPTGPLPQPLVQPKKRYDIQAGPLPRSGSAMDVVEDASLAAQTGVMSQASPPQASLSTRFPALAQAGPVPHAQTLVQPPTPSSLPVKQLKANQSIPQSRARDSRGPALGFFTTDNQRPILQATTSQQAQQSSHAPESSVSQRSLLVAQEAEMERQKALRIEREQMLQREQKEALQRERQYQLKQESEGPKSHRLEQFGAAPVRPSPLAQTRSEGRIQVVSQQRPEELSMMDQPRTELRPLSAAMRNESQPHVVPHSRADLHPAIASRSRPESHTRMLQSRSDAGSAEARRPPQAEASYQPRGQGLRNPPRDIAESQRVPLGPPAPNRGSVSSTLSAPPLPQDQRQTPTAPPPVAPPKQETVRKTSNIMSLLNVESDDRPTPTPPPRRMNDVVSTPMQGSRTPPPQHMQGPRYSVHQQIPQQQATHQHQQSSQAQSMYSRQEPHHMQQQPPAPLGPNRSYTPTNYDRPPFAPPPQIPQQQQMYAQSRQPLAGQHQAIRRDSSITDIQPGGTYGRASLSAQANVRLKESPYPATSPPQQSQVARQQAGSPLEQPLERDYYSRQSQYVMQQQNPGPSSTSYNAPYHSQQPPSHRQIAFSQNRGHAASPPPTPYPPPAQHALHSSRHGSFDNRFAPPVSSGASSAGPAPQSHFAVQSQSSQTPAGYQAQSGSGAERQHFDYDIHQRRLDADRERMMQEDRDRRDRRIMEIDRERRLQQHRDEEAHYRRGMEDRR